MSEETRRATPRLIGIEGVRALAATSILVFHVYLYAAPGGVTVDVGPLSKLFDNLRAGVTLFFVLSGFLLFRPYVAAAVRGLAMPSTRAYLRNRALRIVPAYWVILLAVAVVFQRELLTKPAQFLANLFFLQVYVPDFVPSRGGGLGIAPAWSVCIEVVFYLTVPVFGYAVIRLSRRALGAVPAAFLPVAFMVALGIGSKVVVGAIDPGDRVRTVTDNLFLTHADWFASGMALAVLRVLYEDGRLRLPSWWRPAAVTAAVVLALVGTKLFYDGTLSGLAQQTPLSVSFALLLALVVLVPATSSVPRLLASRPLVFVGLASYSLFLVHDPIVRGFREWGLTASGLAGFAFNLVLIGGLALVLAALSYRFVEVPSLARKRVWAVGSAAGLGTIEPRDVRAPALREAPAHGSEGPAAFAAARPAADLTSGKQMTGGIRP